MSEVVMNRTSPPDLRAWLHGKRASAHARTVERSLAVWPREFGGAEAQAGDMMELFGSLAPDASTLRRLRNGTTKTSSREIELMVKRTALFVLTRRRNTATRLLMETDP